MKEQLVSAMKMRLVDRYDADVVNDIINLLSLELTEYRVEKESHELMIPVNEQNHRTLQMFLVAKRIEGLSDSTLELYSNHSGVENVFPHQFRHTVATNCVGKGMELELVQRMLGHTSANTTLKYAHIKQDAVKSAHQRYVG